ncbi:MAG: 2-hydroxychromene-2-carboxylate isomerase [Betaproteobacteria bacterium SG8_41]|nr:MAG: 2-hydroxychromene-2-carboxylate isomerase [Betaproteobacteria bacterium SG8_41]
MTDRIVDYYFSASSPWTYLGHARFLALAARHGARINVRPVDLTARVFPVSGGLPVKQRPPQRQAYRLVELRRWSASLGVPLHLHPRFFPVATGAASRMIIAADVAQGAGAALELAGKIMAGVWAEERDIADPETLVAMAVAVGLEGVALLQRSQEREIEDRFEGYTQEAISRNVFGAPFYLYRDEPFWGQDRLDFLDRALAAT